MASAFSLGVNSASSLIAQVIVCLMMTGVIWCVQLVIYPLFRCYQNRDISSEEDTLRELTWLHSHYTPKIGLVVIPLMFSELGLSLFHAVYWPSAMAWFGLALVLGNWISTFLLSVPLHNQLASASTKEDFIAASSLVTTNWPRTFLWSFRSGFLIYWFFTLL